LGIRGRLAVAVRRGASRRQGKNCEMRVWRYDSDRDAVPDVAEPGDVDRRRAVFVAALDDDRLARAWMALDDYDESEATVLFGAPAGDQYGAYVRALLQAAIEAARSLGYASLLAHWRAGWSSAQPILDEFGFRESAPGIWRRSLKQ
jgi:GNAT superfamily N-acetyltransferase